MRVVSPLLLLMWMSVIGFSWRFAANLAGNSAGWLAATLLAGTPFLTHVIGLGQDTGATCVGVVGAFAVLTERRSLGWRSAIAAALVFGVAALVREYGAMLMVAVALPLCGRRENWRPLAIFVGCVGLIAAPWYLRNLVRLGHPFHSMPMPLFDPASPVYADHWGTYSDLSVLFTNWYEVAIVLIATMPLLLLLSPAALAWLARNRPLLIGSVGVILLIWFMSLRYSTASLQVSTRMFAPMVFIFAVASVALVSARLDRPRFQWAATAVVSISCLWGLWISSTYPQMLLPTQAGRFVAAFTATDLPVDHTPRIEALPATSALIGERILSGAAYVHASVREIDVEIVPMHSPEVAFLFEDELSTVEMRERLRSLNIEYLIYEKSVRMTPRLSRYKFFSDEVSNWQVVTHWPASNVPLRRIPPVGYADEQPEANNGEAAGESDEADMSESPISKPRLP